MSKEQLVAFYVTTGVALPVNCQVMAFHDYLVYVSLRLLRNQNYMTINFNRKCKAAIHTGSNSDTFARSCRISNTDEHAGGM